MTYPAANAQYGKPTAAAAIENCRHLAALHQRPNPSARFADQRARGLARRQGHGQALESLEQMFRTSRGRFVAAAFSILGNKEDAEDAVHNAFLSAYLHLPNFEGRSSLKTWFTRIVLNAALMIGRKRKSSRFVPLADLKPTEEISLLEQIPVSDPDPEKTYVSNEALKIIDAQLATMQPALRQAFVMNYYQELSHAEACALLGIPLGTFKARLFRARRQVVSRVQSQKPCSASWSRPPHNGRVR